MGAYSQGLRAGDFVYVSGQGPVDPETQQIVGDTIEEQVALTLANVQAVLEAAGASMADVVRSTVHLADIGDFQRFNAVYAEHFPDPKPTRTTVQSVLPGIMVEIDVVAYTGV
jgi:2-iminobutanoate/2-iminopropanoate deaminase